MKFKRIISTALAGALALSMGATAFAADGGDADTPPSNQTVITATLNEQEIAVTVPGTVAAFINPYGVDVNFDEADDSKVLKGFQILSVPDAIYNLSGMDLSVNVTVTGEIPLAEGVSSTNAMKFATASTEGATSTAKNAYVVFQMKQEKTIKDVETVDADTAATAAMAWAVDADADGEVVVKVGEVTGEDMVQLAKAGTKAGKTVVSEGGAALIRLNGDCVSSPKIPWAETDTFKVTVAYTFLPTTIEEAP